MLLNLTELGSSAEVGASVAKARAEIRRLGGQVCRSLDDSELRYDSEYRLNELIAGLDDLDSSSLRPADQLPPGSTLSLMLRGVVKRFDEFLDGLPATPSG